MGQIWLTGHRLLTPYKQKENGTDLNNTINQRITCHLFPWEKNKDKERKEHLTVLAAGRNHGSETGELNGIIKNIKNIIFLNVKSGDNCLHVRNSKHFLKEKSIMGEQEKKSSMPRG